jgi:hypothetical protein
MAGAVMGEGVFLLRRKIDCVRSIFRWVHYGLVLATTLSMVCLLTSLLECQSTWKRRAAVQSVANEGCEGLHPGHPCNGLNSIIRYPTRYSLLLWYTLSMLCYERLLVSLSFVFIRISLDTQNIVIPTSRLRGRSFNQSNTSTKHSFANTC